MHAAITFAASFIAAIAWAKFTRSAVKGRAFEAAAWDLLIVACGNVTLLGIWASSGFSWFILMVGCAASVLGTYITVRWL
jgi:hypothetical protein